MRTKSKLNFKLKLNTGIPQTNQEAKLKIKNKNKYSNQTLTKLIELNLNQVKSE
jgi:hypothetical protein